MKLLYKVTEIVSSITNEVLAAYVAHLDEWFYKESLNMDPNLHSKVGEAIRTKDNVDMVTKEKISSPEETLYPVTVTLSWSYISLVESASQEEAKKRLVDELVSSPKYNAIKANGMGVTVMTSCTQEKDVLLGQLIEYTREDEYKDWIDQDMPEGHVYEIIKELDNRNDFESELNIFIRGQIEEGVKRLIEGDLDIHEAVRYVSAILDGYKPVEGHIYKENDPETYDESVKDLEKALVGIKADWKSTDTDESLDAFVARKLKEGP